VEKKKKSRVLEPRGYNMQVSEGGGRLDFTSPQSSGGGINLGAAGEGKGEKRLFPPRSSGKNDRLAISVEERNECTRPPRAGREGMPQCQK